MTVQKFSAELTPDPKSKDPADQMILLTSAWRRARGMDDSDENLRLSAIAVLRSHPKLAKAYQSRQITLARARTGDDPWAHNEEE